MSERVKDMFTYLDMRNEAVRQISEVFSGNRKIKVAAHPGRFNETEIRRLASQTPAILTSLVNVKDNSDTDNTDIQFITWVLYRADNADRLFDGAVNIVSVLIPVIRSLDTSWSYDVKDVEAENLYSGTLDSMNITLWAVSWKWNVRGTVLNADVGGVLIPANLEYFEGADSSLVVGNQTVSDITNLEVSI